MIRRPAHFERLLRFLRRMGRSREDAEDLIQEAMLRMHVYGQAVAVNNEEAFLRQAVRNLSIDQHRRERLKVEVGIDEPQARGTFMASEATPEDLLVAEQRLANIRTVLDGVSRRTRDIYFAHRAGYSYAEISQHLGISHMTIKRHIARALLALMEQRDTEAHGIGRHPTE